MEPLQPGSPAPEVAGARTADDPYAVFFYKVTCPTCQMAAPVAERLALAAPGRFVAVAQDPPEKVERFGKEWGATFEATSDAEPYPISNAYGVRVVPTVFLIEDGAVTDVVESWDRDGWNRLGANVTGREDLLLSDVGDGLPPFRPG